MGYKHSTSLKGDPQTVFPTQRDTLRIRHHSLASLTKSDSLTVCLFVEKRARYTNTDVMLIKL